MPVGTGHHYPDPDSFNNPILSKYRKAGYLAIVNFLFLPLNTLVVCGRQMTLVRMRNYYIRKILYFIPSVFLLLFCAFLLIHLCPGDPVERMLQSGNNEDESSAASIVHEKEKAYWTHRLGLDQPLFYFSLHTKAEPDTLYKLVSGKERKSLTCLLRENGNTEAIMNYYQLWKEMSDGRDLSNPEFTSSIRSLFNYASFDEQKNYLQNLQLSNKNDSSGLATISFLQNTLQEIQSHPAHLRTWVPCISFNSRNQFHSYLFGDNSGNKGVLRGDWGISYVSKQPVLSLIGDRIGWTLFFTLTSVLLSFLISIPVALKSAAKPGKRFDKNTSLLFTILYSLPAFWLATLLMMFFCNPDMLNLLPASGIKPITGYPAESGFFSKVLISLPYLILPTICYTYSSFAFVTRSIRANAIDVFKQDYIKTARAKGLDEKTILWRHVFRNSLLPIITMFSNVFPYAISGSIILETVFTIPGMGLAMYQSVDALDYPVILAIFTLTGIITIAGFLITDILYSFADPRINLEK